MIKPTESNCCGCRACESACPKKCINMINNVNGFLIPQVDLNLCINCGICEKVCPTVNKIYGNIPRNVFAAYYNDAECVNSTSGGIFYGLAKQFINNGGVVFGSAFNSKLYCEHKKAEKENELTPLQGSKYVQSDIGSSYKSVCEYLNKKRRVLFSGTPCQIAGLMKLLEFKGIFLDNLLTVEILCHGVTSPQMWSDYIIWLERQYGKQAVNYKFRTKKAQGRDFRCCITFSDGQEKILSGFKDPYYKTYMSGTSMREICYECPYARKERAADVTVGDFWNIEDAAVGFGMNKRVSVVMINTNKGKEIWDKVNDRMAYRETNWDLAAEGNINLKSASHKPSAYISYGNIIDKEKFFEIINQKPINRKKELFNMLPPMIRRIIKKIM